jgi:glycosyltransferase involved in cell wall biosynthesis
MDLGYLEFTGQFKKRDFWQLKYWSAISIYISKRIIAISNSTKKEIVRHYPFASNKVDVTLLAYDKDVFNLEIPQNLVRRVRKKYSIVGDYVLFMSTLKPSKNIEGLLDAWKQLVAHFPDTKLVIAGKKGWLYESVFEKVKKLGLKSSVIFTGFVDEEDKPALIKGAKLFTLPSFWEGFGLDALNSMAAGVPVVVSNVGSLPEVVGEAGVLVDPNKPKDIAKGIKKVLTAGKIEYNKMIEKGLSQAKKFSWEKTAKETVKTLEMAAK